MRFGVAKKILPRAISEQMLGRISRTRLLPGRHRSWCWPHWLSNSTWILMIISH